MFAILFMYKASIDEDQHTNMSERYLHIHHEIQERKGYNEENRIENRVRRVQRLV